MKISLWGLDMQTKIPSYGTSAKPMVGGGYISTLAMMLHVMLSYLVNRVLMVPVNTNRNDT